MIVFKILLINFKLSEFHLSFASDENILHMLAINFASFHTN